jgi:hypothetical protein
MENIMSNTVLINALLQIRAATSSVTVIAIVNEALAQVDAAPPATEPQPVTLELRADESFIVRDFNNDTQHAFQSEQELRAYLEANFEPNGYSEVSGVDDLLVFIGRREIEVNAEVKAVFSLA